ncbi:hypothetical protein [Nocardioides bruguierae]|uniref:Uncharacterized protein n=1 Tax=Nocardioides bruguierae TaxID=2945102 RepID=A0A9X2D414_9ACTN|nr:hypothetical protein [Nocardioides bruguierae]MCM0618766.1 hypothetical protein [Nocardioides bruguierae]
MSTAPGLCHYPGGHDDRWACPLHGCPSCAAGAFRYLEPEAYEPPVHRDDPLWEVLSELAEAYVDAEGCMVCREITTRSFWARYPGSECETECLAGHCEACGLCGKSGRVCRNCERCLDCSRDDEYNPCALERWDRTLKRRVVARWIHELLNPRTDRWTRYDTRTGRWGA